jgi:hypothetical protein
VKQFGLRTSSVRPPQKGEEVPMRCRSCGKRFYARDEDGDTALRTTLDYEAKSIIRILKSAGAI